VGNLRPSNALLMVYAAFAERRQFACKDLDPGWISGQRCRSAGCCGGQPCSPFGGASQWAPQGPLTACEIQTVIQSSGNKRVIMKKRKTDQARGARSQAGPGWSSNARRNSTCNITHLDCCPDGYPHSRAFWIWPPFQVLFLSLVAPRPTSGAPKPMARAISP